MQLSLPIILGQESTEMTRCEKYWEDLDFPTKINNQAFSYGLHKSFIFQEIIFKILGRFPFNYYSKNLFVYYVKAVFHWFFFGVTSVCVLVILILSTVGFADFYLDWHFPKNIEKNSTIHKSELKVFSENLVPFVLLWGCMLHVTIGNISFVLNRKKVELYMNLWKDTVDQLYIQVPASIRWFLVQSNIWIMAFLSIVLFFFFHESLSITVCGISKLLMLLTLRLFLPPGTPLQLIQSNGDNLYTTFGLIGLIYIIYASRALVFVYTFKCRLLRHCFRTWNKRLKEELCANRDCSVPENLQMEAEMCEKLFQQYGMIIEMMRKTDIVFAANLESYYLTQILNMCFELYYLAMSGSCVFGTELDGDQMQMQSSIIAGLLVIQTFVIFFTVSLEATYVSDEAMKGFQLIRKRGMQLKDSMEKKYLAQNLLVNYSQTIALTGGRFFSIDRPFIIRVLGAVFTYFIIILQFGSQSEAKCD